MKTSSMSKGFQNRKPKPIYESPSPFLKAQSKPIEWAERFYKSNATILFRRAPFSRPKSSTTAIETSDSLCDPRTEQHPF